MRCAAAVAVTLFVSGCGSSALPPDYRPAPVGRGAAFRLPAVSPAVAARQPIAGLRCTRGQPPSYGIHLELYAQALVLPVPAGIGVAPPQHRSGAYVRGGACSYSVRTFEPTGVVVVGAARRLSLGELFAVWGQPLSRGRLTGFQGAVVAYLNGRRWAGAPAAIPLHRHAEIVLEVGPHVPPHPAYRFPPGL